MKDFWTVIPVTRNYKYVSRALDSLILQRLKPIGCILVIQNTLDEGVFKKKFDKSKIELIIIKLKTKKLASLARNYGANLVPKDTWVHFLDDDDWLSEDFYHNIFLEISKIDKVKYNAIGFFASVNVFSSPPNENLKRKINNKKKIVKYIDLLEENYVGVTSSVVLPINIFKKIKGFRNIFCRQDYQLWLDLANAGIKFNFVQNAEINWTDHNTESSVSRGDINKQINSATKIMQSSLIEISNLNLKNFKRHKTKKNFYKYCLKASLKTNNYFKSIYYFILFFSLIIYIKCSFLSVNVDNRQ